MKPSRRVLSGLAVALLLGLGGGAAGRAAAHTMPEHASPAAGETLSRAPSAVRITFDEALEGKHCKLRVEDAEKRVVSQGPARVDASQPRLLTVGLKPLGPGTYHVYWVAVSRDGHRTQGDYSFAVSRRPSTGDAPPSP